MNEILKRLFKYSIKTKKGCINYNGVTSKNEYAKFYYNKKHISAHRASWELQRGVIPKNMFVCHTCDNRRCINIDHLFLGSRQDNVLDMVKKGRNAKNEKHGMVKLSNQEILEIRQLKEFGFKHAWIAQLYNVSDVHIFYITSGKLRKDIK